MRDFEDEDTTETTRSTSGSLKPWSIPAPVTPAMQAIAEALIHDDSIALMREIEGAQFRALEGAQ